MRAITLLVVLALASGCAVQFPQATEQDRKLADFVAGNTATPRPEFESNPDAGPGAIALLADAFRSTDPNVVHRAERAASDVVHASARPGATTERRQSVLALESLLDATPALPATERRFVCRLLGAAISDSAERMRLEARKSDPQLADDVAFALARSGPHDEALPLADQTSSTWPQSRCAGLRAAAQSDTKESQDALLSALRDESASVRAVAAEILATRASRGLDDVLREELEASSDPDGKARIVTILEARHALDWATIDRVLASHEEAPLVAVAEALANRGDAKSEARLGDLALAPRSSTMNAHAALLSALARLAQRDAFAGDRDAAMKISMLVQSATKDDATRAEALKVFATLADPETRPLLDAFDADAGPLAHAQVVRTRLAIADKLRATDPAAATDVYRKILDQPGDRRLRETALRRLTAQGVDAKSILAKQGILLDWRVLGPLPRDAMAFEEQPFGAAIDPNRPFEHGGKTFAWTPLSTTDLDGHVDLLAHFDGKNDCIAFATATFVADDAFDGTLAVGSDDGVAIWVNGERVLAHDVARAWSPGEEQVQVHFVKGANGILLKITQGGGDFGFSAQVPPRAR